MLEYQKALNRSNDLIKQSSNEQIDGIVASSLVQLACIFSNAALELCFKELMTTYCSNKSTRPITNYLTSKRQLGSFRNPTFNKFTSELEKFDKTWSQELKDKTSDQTKVAIEGIINNRNQIAHGKFVGISASILTNYNREVKKFCESLYEIEQIDA